MRLIQRVVRALGELVSNERHARASVRCVVVGDGSTGKTCLLWSYTTKRFPPEGVSSVVASAEGRLAQAEPTLLNNYSARLIHRIDGGRIGLDLALCDTCGQEEYDRLRPITSHYATANVFIVAFSLTCRASFESVASKWSHELKLHGPHGVPIVLVGLKLDLRAHPETLARLDDESPPTKPVGFNEGLQMARAIGAVSYVECSAVTLEGKQGVRNVFDNAIRAALAPVWQGTHDNGGGGGGGGGGQRSKRGSRVCLHGVPWVRAPYLPDAPGSPSLPIRASSRSSFV